MNTYSYDPFTIIDLASNFGGFFGCLKCLSFIPIFINSQFILKKFVRRLYFDKDDDLLIKDIKFNHLTYTKQFLSFFSFKENTELHQESKLYSKGITMVQQEMNMFFLLQTIRKLKAAMTVIFGDDKEKIEKAE